MTHAQARGWGDPTAKGYRADHIVGVQAAGTMLYLRREVAHLFMGFLQEIVHRGYQLNNVRDDWGYAYRPIRGYEDEWATTHDYRYLSNHSWGLAVDLDATSHPLGHRDTGIPAWVVETAHKWGLFWGGDYKNRPDEMHFEFVGTPHDVAKYPTYTDEELRMDADAKAAFAAVDDRLDQLEAHLDKISDALAGWQPGRKDRSLIGRIGDHFHIAR